jgi:hypothetical protein
VIKLLPVPNPQSGPFISVAFDLAAPADSIELRLYTSGLTLVEVQKISGNFPVGWSSAKFDNPGLVSGVYYVQLSATNGAEKGLSSAPVTLMWLP